MDVAKGEYICRSDADDLNMVTRLENQLEFMESHPDIDVVGYKYVCIYFGREYHRRNNSKKYA